MKQVDGNLLRQAFINAYDLLSENRDFVNGLNVFPVPDGDTGTNMGLTMKSAISQLKGLKDPTVSEVAKAVSNGALMGARGNSGVILSQLLRGVYQALKDKEIMDKAAMRNVFIDAAQVAYKAVMKPTEGTILTVARKMGESATAHFDRYKDMKSYMHKVLSDGDWALKDTPNLLPVLKEAGVVDAGGQGLMIILQGIYGTFTGEMKTGNYDFEASDSPVTNHMTETASADIRYGYCTEFLINTDKDMEAFRDKIEPWGDSMIVVQGEGLIKTHIHTNNPGRVLEEALKLGYLTDIKIDNMRVQHSHVLLDADERKAVEHGPVEEVVEITKDYGFVAVAMGDGNKELFQQLGVDEVIAGGQTMNPSTEDLHAAIKRVPAKTVYVFPNNSNIIMAAEQAGQLAEDREVIVIPSKSIPMCSAALLAFDGSADAQTNADAMKAVMEGVSTRSVTFAVRDSNIDHVSVKKDDFIGLKDGKIKVAGKDMMEVAFDIACYDADDASLITVYQGLEATEEDTEELVALLEEKYPDVDVDSIYGGQPLYYFLISVE